MDKELSLLRILEKMPVPALIASPISARILWANARLLAMYGVEDPARVVGLTLFDFVQASQLGKALADLAKVVAGQSPPPVTYQLRTADGGYAAGQVSSVPMMFRGNVAMLSFVTDVTERERTLASLSESEERYRLLLDSMPSGVAVVVDGTIAYANESLSNALGLSSPADLIGRPMHEFIAERYRKPVEAARRAMMLSGKNHPSAPVSLIRIDGSEIATTAASTVIRWQGALATQTLMHDLGVSTT